MRTRIFTLRIFTLLVAFLAIAGNAVWGQTFSGGSGTEIDPYLISSSDDLKSLAESVNSGELYKGVYFELTQNIDLEGNEENQWTPIGFYSTDSKNKSFCGIFDGKDNVISGLYISNSEDDIWTYGLFGYTENAKIKNITVKGCIKAKGMIGGISANSHGGEFINCHNEVNINAEGNQLGQYIAGICGTAQICNIEKCSNKGDICLSASNIKLPEITMAETSICIGGICGYMVGDDDNRAIKNSYNEGDITVNGSNNEGQFFIGGIFGHVSVVNLENCYNQGNINTEALSLVTTKNYAKIYIGGIGGYQPTAIPNTKCSITYCYNIGELKVNRKSIDSAYGYICGCNGNAYMANLIENCYYINGNSQIQAVGIGSKTGSEAKDNPAFESGEVAWLLHNAGGNFGQGLDEDGKYVNEENRTPVLLAFNEGTEVYQLKLNVNDKETTIYRNAIKSNLLPQTTYEEIMAKAEEGQDLVWTNKTGEVVAYGNTYTPTEDATLTAELKKVYTISTIVEPAGAGTILVQAKAQEGDEISFIVTANEGYELASVSAGEIALTEANGSYSFTMPAANVTITATFNKVETEQPGDDDEDQGDTGIHKPQRPIKYYNIYVDTICPGLNVEVSKDVVQEGHQVSAYLTIQAECDTTGMRFEYKRGLFGYWKDLKELEGVQPGEYIIKNIYTDIYIRALDAT